jgi:phosphate transport system substrate-binding protein
MEQTLFMRSLVIILIGISAASVQGQTKPPHARPTLESFRASVDGNLRRYKPTGHVSGSLRAVQSDTTPGMVELWIKGFAKYHPDVGIKADIEGSGAAGPSLTNGTADFGIIAREMMPKEKGPFETKFGYKPLEIAVAGGSYRTLAFTDALTFFVHKGNPLEKLSFAQLDAIYSKTRNRKHKQDITTWGQLGLTGDWSDKPIHLSGVKEPNGFEYFLRLRVLKGGDWKDGITVRDTVHPLAALVAADRYAIGYAGFSYLTEGVKTLALAKNDSGAYYKGTFEEVAAQKYPLSRLIYVYANRVPGKPLDPKLREFVIYILSEEGQQAVVQDGVFLPLPFAVVKRELAKIE